MRLVALILLWLMCMPSALAAETRTFFAMDTVMTISAAAAEDSLVDGCEEYISRLESLVSVTDMCSEIYALNSTGSAALSPETEEMLKFALDMCADTGGALDITLYPIVRAWGFTTGDYRVPDGAELDALLTNVDYKNLTLENGLARIENGAQADLGSVAKGWSADGAAEILRSGGVHSALLDLGGNIYCVGEKPDGAPWRVGLRDPEGEGYMGVVEVRDLAVVTSGCYERYFEQDGMRYGHIFDPDTGMPAENGLLSVTVIGKSASMCDALSTALYVMGPVAAREYLSGRDDVLAVLVLSDGSVMASAGLKENFVTAGNYAKAGIIWF